MNQITEKPVIPADEFPKRWKMVQQMMADQKLDILVAYADDRAVFGPAHARWMADFPVHFEPVCILFAPQGAPVMLVGPESDEYALLRGQIKDVRILAELTHPDEDYPFSTMQNLGEIINELGFSTGGKIRVGIGGRGLIGADLLAAFEQSLPNTRWVDVENGLCNLRACKSPAEIAVIRHAYTIAQIGLKAAMETIAPGVSERALAAEIESAMRRAGAEGTGIDTIVACGPNTRPILARSTFRKIGQNDQVLLTIAPRYEGYHAAIGRPVLVGKPEAAIEQALEVALRAQTACFEALETGRKGREIEAVGRRIVEQAGLGELFLYSGVHSLGVIEFEPPIFGPGSDALLRENMVVSVDIPMFNAPWGGLRVEDGYLMGANKAQKLNQTPGILRA